MVPNLFFNMRKALLPLMAGETYAAFQKVTTWLEARVRTTSRGSTRNGREKEKRPGHEQENKGTGSQLGDELPECKKPKTEVNAADVAANSASCEDGYCAPCHELC